MKKTALIILDGWGIGKEDDSNGIFNAKTPFIDSLSKKYASGKLITYGEKVGLPEGQMGNSEVGHLNIGAGRIVYQDYLKINIAIENKTFFENKEILNAIAHCKKHNTQLHFIGLVSRGGVHSSQEHLYALCDLAEKHNVNDCYIHAFTDGRDCDPKSGYNYLIELERYIKDKPVKIASVIGRYFAMDRDNRWGRVAKAYNLMTKNEGQESLSASAHLKASYENGIYDEFIEPGVINKDGIIEENDAVICFNFRTDRCREITVALTQKDFPEHQMNKFNLHYCTMTNYDRSFKGVKVAFDKDNLKNTLGEVISDAGKTQIRIAETEKYPHVTFFFSGGREKVFKGESRLMAKSPDVATYDLQPEMSAHEVTDKICYALANDKPDFVCLNFANPDMVGHTGVSEAITKACETIDYCTQKVVEKGLENDYSFVIIADHGNADKIKNEDGSPNTAHTTNMVPIYVIDRDTENINDGILADVAPTILKLMGIKKPAEMTGSSLLK